MQGIINLFSKFLTTTSNYICRYKKHFPKQIEIPIDREEEDIIARVSKYVKKFFKVTLERVRLIN